MSEATSPESPWLATKEIAARAKCHEQTVLRALRSGALKGSQRGRGSKWFATVDAVDAWRAGENLAVAAPASRAS
jgi:hypothetical protein